LTINIPDKKNSLVKLILIGLGVTIQQDSYTNTNTAAYKKNWPKFQHGLMMIWSF